jgi:hypothetical protein
LEKRYYKKRIKKILLLPGSGVGIGIPTSLPNERYYIKKLDVCIINNFFFFLFYKEKLCKNEEK